MTSLTLTKNANSNEPAHSPKIPGFGKKQHNCRKEKTLKKNTSKEINPHENKPSFDF